MRRLLLLSIILTVFISCGSPEKVAQKLIKQHLKETLHDFKSYEPVKFGTLDSVYTSIDDKAEYQEIVSNYLEHVNDLATAVEEAKRYRDLGYLFESEKRSAYNRATKLLEIVDAAEAIIDSLQTAFKSEFDGWSMEHSLRANNAGGNMTIHHELFYFDKDLTKIVKTKDVGENAKKED